MTKTEKIALRKLIVRPLFRKAIEEVCFEIHQFTAGKDSLEEAALAYKFQSGAVTAFNKLYGLAAVKETITIQPKRLKQETSI